MFRSFYNSDLLRAVKCAAPRKFMHFGDETFQVSHDRSSAHFAAWYSPKREPEKVGEHFKPEDLTWCCFL